VETVRHAGDAPEERLCTGCGGDEVEDVRIFSVVHRYPG
jgi:hypothetical protein